MATTDPLVSCRASLSTRKDLTPDAASRLRSARGEFDEPQLGTRSCGSLNIRPVANTKWNCVGSDPDIVVASAKAYLSGLNKLHSKIERVNPQL